jgi:sugar/nucleoside kinase (ribokinase family)
VGSVLSAGIIVADHVCSPITHLPSPGELVLADKLLLTIGGCAANVAVDLVKLGVKARVAGCVGGDVFGRVVADMLRDHGVDVSALQVRSTLDTSQTLIINVKGQDRRFVHTFGANSEFSTNDIPEPPAGGILYLGGYLVLPRMGPTALAATFEMARQAGAKTVLDVVTPGPGNYVPFLAPVLPHVDVFLPNDHEGLLITGESDPIRQAECFREMGAGTVIVTQGDHGSVLMAEGLRLRAGAFPVAFIDGSGGGDAFAAGYMAGMLDGLSPEECLRLASAVGASCVRAIGTTAAVFTREEANEFIRRHKLKIERF